VAVLLLVGLVVAAACSAPRAPGWWCPPMTGVRSSSGPDPSRTTSTRSPPTPPRSPPTCSAGARTRSTAASCNAAAWPALALRLSHLICEAHAGRVQHRRTGRRHPRVGRTVPLRSAGPAPAGLTGRWQGHRTDLVATSQTAGVLCRDPRVCAVAPCRRPGASCRTHPQVLGEGRRAVRTRPTGTNPPVPPRPRQHGSRSDAAHRAARPPPTAPSACDRPASALCAERRRATRIAFRAPTTADRG
jgi:hypothetical protein